MSINDISQHKLYRNSITFFGVLIASLMQALIIQSFMMPCNLLSSGFTGVAILIEKITSAFFNFSFSASLGMILLNVPVALMCMKSISKRFTFFSLLEVFLASFFLKVIKVPPLFSDTLLNLIFGGFLYGVMTVIALKVNASTGGTDFIALYVSNKKGKSIFKYVFIFNASLLVIFGLMFGVEKAGYSILFQYISTKTIEYFYKRFERITLQITTSKANEIIKCLVSNYRHGITKLDGVGGYSGKHVNLLYTVVSEQEVPEIVSLIKRVDQKAIVNAIRTENFYGGFYIKPID